MNRAAFVGVFSAVALVAPTAAADVTPATIRVPEPTAWVGQRLAFLVELRAPGPFDGAASFSIPQIPRAVILKIGNPVVSSEEVGDESVTVQTHEFALFSQQSGTVEIPAFEVRFSHRTGFTGPVVDKVAKVPATRVEIKRPPGSDGDTFLVTTTSLDISEEWDPQPGSAEQGAVFRRTITQKADQVTGMALAPPPGSTPDGVRVYPGRPEVNDQTERGDFTGNRTDTITYVMREPGTWTLPAVRYVWWDPEKKTFGSRTLPAVTFEVAAEPKPAAGGVQPARSDRKVPVWVALGVTLIAILGWRCHRSIREWGRRVWRHWNPPDRVAARKLVRACGRDDAKAAEAAWVEWRNTQPSEFEPEPELGSAVLALHRCLVGPPPRSVWRGETLGVAFRRHLGRTSSGPNSHRVSLPKLN